LLQWWWRQKTDVVDTVNGVCRVFNPRLTWSPRFPFGGIEQLVRVNRKNFKLACSRFGAVQLIHAHVSYPAGYVASLLSREFDVPYVITEHMSPFPFPDLMQDGQPLDEISQAFKSASATIAVGPALADRIASFGYRRPAIIPNLVDERRFHVGRPREDKVVFFTLCVISEQKGIDQLLEAIALWNPPASRFEFQIGGDGPKRAEYEAQARRLGLADRVRWLGAISRERAPDLFRQSHVFVLPSRHESFGIVYAEALACGKPVIATRCGGPEDIVNSGNGLLVDVGDVSGLAQAMRSMASNWEAYDPNWIREDFENRFSRGAVVSRVRATYHEALGRTP
jgi:glycosyltransferase involved in cell wall biosynthesis